MHRRVNHDASYNTHDNCVASLQGVHKRVINELLKPKFWKPSDDRRFLLNADEICGLCDAAQRIFEQESSVLELRGAGHLDLHVLVFAEILFLLVCSDSGARTTWDVYVVSVSIRNGTGARRV